MIEAANSSELNMEKSYPHYAEGSPEKFKGEETEINLDNIYQ